MQGENGCAFKGPGGNRLLPEASGGAPGTPEATGGCPEGAGRKTAGGVCRHGSDGGTGGSDPGGAGAFGGRSRSEAWESDRKRLGRRRNGPGGRLDQGGTGSGGWTNRRRGSRGKEKHGLDPKAGKRAGGAGCGAFKDPGGAGGEPEKAAAERAAGKGGRGNGTAVRRLSETGRG